jgi:hypothetical protein
VQRNNVNVQVTMDPKFHIVRQIEDL